MKRTFIVTVCAALACYSAEALVLVTGTDFANNELTNLGSGKAFRTHGNNGNSFDNETLTLGSGKGFLADGGLAGTAAKDDGLTITFDLKTFGSPTLQNADLFTMRLNEGTVHENNTYAIKVSTSGSISIYYGAGTSYNTEILSLTGLTFNDTTWNNIALTYSESTWTLAAYDTTTGDLIASNSVTDTLIDGNQVQFFQTLDPYQNKFGNESNGIALDDVGIYSGAASVAQQQIIATGGLLAVPEPASITLSLLALTGLAARRRRK